MRLKILITALLLASLAILFIDRDDADIETKPLISIGSGPTNGLFYPIAENIAQLLNQSQVSFNANAIPTRGSVYNMNALRQNSLQLALVQSDIAYDAYHGVNVPSFDHYPVNNVRGIAVLYPEVVHIVTSASSKIDSVDQLRGKRVFIGDLGSGAEQNAIQILSAYGLTINDIKAVRGSTAFGLEQIKDSRVDAIFYTIGLGSEAIESINEITPIKFVPLHHQQLSALLEQYPFYELVDIPANTYARISTPTLALSMTTLLVANTTFNGAEDDEKPVQQVMETLFNNISRFKAINPILAKHFSLPSAVKGMPIPLHCDAVIFYEKNGVEVPEELITNC